jgi:hypothetical protein
VFGSDNTNNLFKCTKDHLATLGTGNFDRRIFTTRSRLTFVLGSASTCWGWRPGVSKRRIAALAENSLNSINENTIKVHDRLFDKSLLHILRVMSFENGDFWGLGIPRKEARK